MTINVVKGEGNEGGEMRRAFITYGRDLVSVLEVRMIEFLAGKESS